MFPVSDSSSHPLNTSAHPGRRSCSYPDALGYQYHHNALGYQYHREAMWRSTFAQEASSQTRDASTSLPRSAASTPSALSMSVPQTLPLQYRPWAPFQHPALSNQCPVDFNRSMAYDRNTLGSFMPSPDNTSTMPPSQSDVDASIKGKRYCMMCEKTYSSTTTFLIHLRSHTGVKPYSCNFCQRRFADRSTLVKHCRVHTGQKPYQCQVCFQTFSQSGNLRRHERSQHQKQSQYQEKPLYQEQSQHQEKSLYQEQSQHQEKSLYQEQSQHQEKSLYQEQSQHQEKSQHHAHTL